MSAPSRELEDRIGPWFPPLVRELVLRYVEENPEAANDPRLVAHALIAPLCQNSKDKQDVWDKRLGWAFLERLLQAGADRSGAYLSQAECKLLLQVIRGERKPIQGKRPARRDSEIAEYLELLDADGWPPEAAAAKAKTVYGVGARETVYAAKRKRKKEAAMLALDPKGRDMTAEARRSRIEFLERQAVERWRRPKRPRRSSPI